MRSSLVLLVLLFAPALSAEKNPFLGSWAFSLPDGYPAWLMVEGESDEAAAKFLWAVGSAKPVKDLVIQGPEISFSRNLKWREHGDEVVRHIRQPISGRLDGDSLLLSVVHESGDGENRKTMTLTGKRMPPMPERPDLSKINLGGPIPLIGTDLSGWRLTNPKKKNGWRVEDGVLINETPKTDFKAYGVYGNLRTVREFEDFELSIEYNVAQGANSGIYLRGAYEVQVVDRDSKMQGIQGPGAVFGRIIPKENAANPGGEWNRYKLTLVDRHITVELNGVVVIDNQPLEGCTGGGISADDTRPGPIFLQGDHTSVRYRNIVLRPVVNER